MYFVILLGRFPLVIKIKKNFGHFFHFIAVQNVSRNHFLNQDKMEKWSNFSKFLLNKCMKTIQVIQQSIFFYFGIDFFIVNSNFSTFPLFFHKFFWKNITVFIISRKMQYSSAAQSVSSNRLSRVVLSLGRAGSAEDSHCLSQRTCTARRPSVVFSCGRRPQVKRTLGRRAVHVR